MPMNEIKIKVPEGQTTEINQQADGNVLVTFKPIEHWKSIKTFEDAYRYLSENGLCANLLWDYGQLISTSYLSALARYRIVVAALTNNEERHLTTGERWFPVVQFCKPGKEKNCWGSEILGSIESEGQKFTVVGGHAHYDATAGLGGFYSNSTVSSSGAYVSFRSVSSQEIAEHISKYFGCLLFEVHYGGVGCNWKWID